MNGKEHEKVETDDATGIDSEPLVDDTPTVESTSLTNGTTEEEIDEPEQLVEEIEPENDEHSVEAEAPDVKMPEEMEIDKYSELVDDTLENALSEREETEKSENDSVIEIVPGGEEHDGEESAAEADEMDEVG